MAKNELKRKNLGRIEAQLYVEGNRPYSTKVKGVKRGGEEADLYQQRRTGTVFGRNETTGDTGYINQDEVHGIMDPKRELPVRTSGEVRHLDGADRRNGRGKSYRQAAYGSSKPEVDAEPGGDPSAKLNRGEMGGWSSPAEQKKAAKSGNRDNESSDRVGPVRSPDGRTW